MFRALLALIGTRAQVLTRAGSIRLPEKAGITPVGQLGGGSVEYLEFLQSIDLANVVKATAANQDVTVTGLKVGDIPLFCNAAGGLVADIILTALGPVATDNTLRVRVANPTAGDINPTAVDFVVGVFRPAA